MTPLIDIGGVSDIDAIAGFQVAMALESEGTELDKETVTKGVAAAMNLEALCLHANGATGTTDGTGGCRACMSFLSTEAKAYSEPCTRRSRKWLWVKALHR